MDHYMHHGTVSKVGKNPVCKIKDRVLGPLLMASLLYLALNFLLPVVHFFALCSLLTMCRQSTCLCIVKLRALESMVCTCYTEKPLYMVQ